MTKFKLIGAAVLSLALAGPATAAAYVTSREMPTGYHGRYLHAQDFDNQDFGIAQPTYPSGWGGPYGDGQYSGSIDRNMGPPYWGSR